MDRKTEWRIERQRGKGDALVGSDRPRIFIGKALQPNGASELQDGVIVIPVMEVLAR